MIRSTACDTMYEHSNWRGVQKLHIKWHIFSDLSSRWKKNLELGTSTFSFLPIKTGLVAEAAADRAALLTTQRRAVHWPIFELSLLDIQFSIRRQILRGIVCMFTLNHALIPQHSKQVTVKDQPFRFGLSIIIRLYCTVRVVRCTCVLCVVTLSRHISSNQINRRPSFMFHPLSFMWCDVSTLLRWLPAIKRTD